MLSLNLTGSLALFQGCDWSIELQLSGDHRQSSLRGSIKVYATDEDALDFFRFDTPSYADGITRIRMSLNRVQIEELGLGEFVYDVNLRTMGTLATETKKLLSGKLEVKPGVTV